jgi:plasmid stabilization system protein ParE
MVRVIITALAKRDLRHITSDLNAKAGYLVAARYAASFKSVYRGLIDFPDRGSPRPALGPLARVAIVSPYLVIYDHEGEMVTVLRVLHGKRNITRDLLGR